MGLITLQPTSNTTPDPAQGGLAVTGAINTGHGSTITSAPSTLVTRSCVWSGFPALPAIGGSIKSMTLKFDWTEDGILNQGTGSATNQFRTEFSVNGGSSFTGIFTHTDVVSPTSSSSSRSITLPQDPTQIQIHDRMQAQATVDPTDNASITTSIGNIRLEVVTIDTPPPVWVG